MNTLSRHAALRWILVPEAAKANAGALITLNADKIKHLRKVLRMEWGEEIRALDGMGRAFHARLEETSVGGAVRLSEIFQQVPAPTELELVICLPKNTTMDWVVEKAVECGVTRVVPLVSSRSVVRVDSKETEKYVRRWQTIMDGAVEQSERLWRPIVSPPLDWQKGLNHLNSANDSNSAQIKAFAFVSETRGAKSDAQALNESWDILRTARTDSSRIVIGPEGGFSDKEREDMQKAGFIEVSLGTSVLRVETAVIAALTLVRVSRIVSVS